MHTSGSSLSDIAKSAAAVEYTDCISAEDKDPNSNECSRYDTKQYDSGGSSPVALGKIIQDNNSPYTPYCHCSQDHSDPEWSHLVGSYLLVKSGCLTFKQCANKWFLLNWIVRNGTVCREPVKIELLITGLTC